jgi:hypothetical protein
VGRRKNRVVVTCVVVTCVNFVEIGWIEVEGEGGVVVGVGREMML